MVVGAAFLTLRIKSRKALSARIAGLNQEFGKTVPGYTGDSYRRPDTVAFDTAPDHLSRGSGSVGQFEIKKGLPRITRRAEQSTELSCLWFFSSGA